MNTNRSGIKTITVGKARNLMHEIYKRAYQAGRAEAQQEPKSEHEALAQRLKAIKEELQK